MANDFKSILLGEGAIYKDYDETGELLIGYTRGGSFSDNYAIRHIEVDGKKGDLKGDAIVESVRPVLQFTAMQMESGIVKEIFSGVSATDDGSGIVTIKRALTVTDDDYATNYAFVGKTKEGKDVVIMVTNALAEGPVTFSFADKSEVEIPMMFVGNYTALTDTNAPYEIIIDESVEE